MSQVGEREQFELQLREDMAGFELDPHGWVLYCFPWGEGELEGHDGPDEWQTELLIRMGQQLQAGADLGCVIREAVASGHGIGKSAFVAWVILWALSTFEDTMGVVTANTETQLKTKTWAAVATWHRRCIVRHWFQYTATALFSVDPEHSKTWRFDMVPWSEKNTEAFAGLHNAGKRVVLIFDEASAIHDVIWEVAEGALTDLNTQILWLAFGNPTRNNGRFRECFRKFAKRWGRVQIDSRTCKMTNKKQIKEWEEDYGENSDFFKVRVRGIFPSLSARQFFNEADVDAAYGRVLRPEQYNFAPKILTLDPAWEGDDFLVFGLRQGLSFRILKKIPKNDNDIYIAQILAGFEDAEEADAVFVDLGYGTGVVSAGRTWGRKWTLVAFAGGAADPGFLNKRAEMAMAVKKWLKEGGSIQPDPALRDAILQPETVPRLDGKIQLESKKEIKKRLGVSSGEFDCLLLSFAFPVTKKIRGPLGGNGTSKHVVEYNPYD